MVGTQLANWIGGRLLGHMAAKTIRRWTKFVPVRRCSSRATDTSRYCIRLSGVGETVTEPDGCQHIRLRDLLRYNIRSARTRPIEEDL